MTAGHCIKNKQLNNLNVTLGEVYYTMIMMTKSMMKTMVMVLVCKSFDFLEIWYQTGKFKFVPARFFDKSQLWVPTIFIFIF